MVYIDHIGLRTFAFEVESWKVFMYRFEVRNNTAFVFVIREPNPTERYYIQSIRMVLIHEEFRLLPDQNHPTICHLRFPLIKSKSFSPPCVVVM